MSSQQLPYLELPDSTSALLDLIGDKNELGKRLRMLDEYVAKVNALLRRYNQYKAPDDLMRAALAEEARAKEIKSEADAYAKQKRGEADHMLLLTGKQLDEKEVFLKGYSEELNATAGQLREKEILADNKLAAAQKMAEDAEVTKRDAVAAKEVAEAAMNSYMRKAKALETAALAG